MTQVDILYARLPNATCIYMEIYGNQMIHGTRHGNGCFTFCLI